MSETERTPALADFLTAWHADDNEWWRLQSGDHLNLFEELLDERDAARIEVARLRGVVEAVQALADEWERRPEIQVTRGSSAERLRAALAPVSSGEAVHGALARAEALAAGDPKWMECVSWPPSSGEAESGDRREGCWCYSCDAAAPSFMFRTRMNLCPDCGNKRCPRATWHGHRCTGSNEAGQPGSIYGGQNALPSGGQADGEGEARELAGVLRRLDGATFGKPDPWLYVAEKLLRTRWCSAARPVLSREALAKALGEHYAVGADLTTPRQYTERGGWNVTCTCGDPVGESGDDDIEERHNLHVADVVLDVLAGGEQE